MLSHVMFVWDFCVHKCVFLYLSVFLRIFLWLFSSASMCASYYS